MRRRQDTLTGSRLRVILAVGIGLGAIPAVAKAERLPAGALSTSGNQIVSATGEPVRIVSVGVFTDVSGQVANIGAAGFNTIRVEWGNRELDSDITLLDRIVEAARGVGLKVILDDHFNEGVNSPCFAQQANGLWYDSGGASDGTDGCHTPGTITDAKFIADWQRVAVRYKGNDTVIGYDLWNEPLAYNLAMSTWEPGSNNRDHNIRYMYERAGNAILAIDPTKLIICEGPQRQHSFADHDTPAPWGDLSLAGKFPVQLSVPAKLVYSIHDYPSEIGGSTPDSGPAKITSMTRVWGYLVAGNIAPVWIGEMGANMKTANDSAWAQTLVDYADGRASGDGTPRFGPGQQGIGIDWWWAGYDARSGDQPSGIFNADGSINVAQQKVYRSFMQLRK
jgi:endoglucanase